MELSKKEFDTMRVRRSTTDINLLFTWLRNDGEIRIVEKETPEPESLDANLEDTLVELV